MTPPEGYSLLDFETQRIQTPFELTEKHLIEGLAVYPKYLDGGFPGGRIRVKPNVVEFEQEGLGEGPRRGAIFVGRLSEEKGVRTQ